MVYMDSLMPHKTKKRKIIADYRKRLRELHSPEPSLTLSLAPAKKQEKSSMQQAVKAKRELNPEHLTTQKLYIKKDLSKTLVLSVLAIFAEFVLYLLTSS